MSQTFGRFHCNYCQENISGLRIRCVECDDFDLCLQCFACGAEIGPHKNNHSYQFMDPGSFVLFGNCDWRAREDVRLLDAIEQYGYGNWVDIAKHIEHRSADEAQERYITYFVDGELGQATLGQCQHEQGGDCAVAVDHTAPSGGQLSASLSPGLSPLNIDPLHASQLIYMPLRDDFEREFDNECEQLVSQLNIGSVEDEEIDTALKLAHVDMYVARIRERARRKRVARDFQLASAFFDELRRDALLQVPGGARMPRRKRERTSLSVQLRVLGQFLTRAEFERFHKNLQTQRDLLHRVKELIRYRRNGITRLEDCVEFERSKAKREQDPTKKMECMSPLIDTRTTSMTGVSRSDGSDLATTNSRREHLATGAISWHNEPCSTNNINNNRQQNVGSSVWGWRDGDGSLVQSSEKLSESAGHHMISAAERALCARLSLRPADYTAIKLMLVCEVMSWRALSSSPSSSSSASSSLHALCLDRLSRVPLDKTHVHSLALFLSNYNILPAR